MPRVTDAPIEVDEEGLRLAVELSGLCEVVFDGVAVWSFVPPEWDGGEPALVPWPENMKRYLDGVAEVRVRNDERVFELGTTSFGDGAGRVEFVDHNGIPIVIDKWGIIQRPFEGRGQGVAERMLDVAQRIIDVLEEDCGLSAWMAFGTLLGAAREGGLIGHDSDIDLAFLSHQTTPAGVARDMFRARRALARRGLRVINKTASFVTVVFRAPDGGQASIDLYACFYVGELLHETATVRARVPQDAILPLRTLSFEGRMLPAPADPDVVLTASYGPDWRVPDPGFRHAPGREIVDRFDDWFGTVMTQRRAWEVFWRDSRDAHDADGPGLQHPSPFAEWVAPRLPPSSLVIDVGAGSGRDAQHFVAAGHRAIALDYARGSFRGLGETGPDLLLDRLNLYDARDALTRSALIARRRGHHVVYARSLLDALDASGVENFWRFLRVVVRGGGAAFLEFAEGGAGPLENFYRGRGGRRFAVDPHVVRQRVRALGGTVTVARRDRVPGSEGTHRWRIAAVWGQETEGRER